MAASSAQAQQILLNAVSYGDIPRGEAVMVEVFDDSEENLSLKRSFEEELRAAGYTVSDGAYIREHFFGADSRLKKFSERSVTEYPDEGFVRIKYWQAVVLSPCWV